MIILFAFVIVLMPGRGLVFMKNGWNTDCIVLDNLFNIFIQVCKHPYRLVTLKVSPNKYNSVIQLDA